jgi:hypothetical protein
MRDAGCERDDRTGVFLGLQQARDELGLVGADQRRRRLQAQVAREPVRQHVAVRPPPARRVGLPHPGQQRVAFLHVVLAVQREQVDDVAFLEADPAQLHPADLRLRGADRITGLGPGQAPFLAQSPQVRADQDPDGRGCVARTVLLR